MCWPPGRNTTGGTPIRLRGPGPIRRCGNGSPSMLPEFVALLRARASRGGNLLGTPEAGVIRQEPGQAALRVAAADAPDRGPVAFQAGGYCLDRFARGDG